MVVQPRQDWDSYNDPGPLDCPTQRRILAQRQVRADLIVVRRVRRKNLSQAAHKDAGQNKPLYIDHPQFEGFEVRQTVCRGEAAVA